MNTDCYQSDYGRQQSRKNENIPPHTDSVGKISEPSIHHVIGQRPGYYVCGKHPFREFFRQQQYDLLTRGAQDFADTDLLRSLHYGIGSQSEQAKAGHEDSEKSECDIYFPDLFFFRILASEIIVDKIITVIEISEITPKEPSQLSETNSTKSNRAGNNSPDIIPNTKSDSNIPLNADPPRFHIFMIIKHG